MRLVVGSMSKSRIQPFMSNLTFFSIYFKILIIISLQFRVIITKPGIAYYYYLTVHPFMSWTFFSIYIKKLIIISLQFRIIIKSHGIIIYYACGMP